MSLDASWRMVEAGYRCDYLRVPEPLGRDTLKALASRPEDLARLGAVFYSERSRCTYFEVTPGATAQGWPPGCELLGRGCWVGLPDMGAAARLARWLHQPTDPDQLSGAAWLATALNTTQGNPMTSNPDLLPLTDEEETERRGLTYKAEAGHLVPRLFDRLVELNERAQAATKAAR